jgi:hypothetical protein
MTSIEKRARRAAEQLLEDSSLTGDLMDTEGKRLLQWGITLAERLAAQTEGIPDEEADVTFEAHLEKLRGVIRRINRLVGQAPLMDPEKATSILTRLLEDAAELPVSLAWSPENITAEAAVLLQLPADQALDRLLSLIQYGG